MSLTKLKYIVAVACEKHFGRAAEACFVSQPTLSVAIKKLEEELDVKLFERGASEVSVTPLGDEIVRLAQAVIEQARRSRRSPSAARTRSRAHCGWPRVRASPATPTRRVVLAWPRPFTRHAAIAALRNCIYDCELPGVPQLSA
jgi:DNA-binding transcriptional LysR family regulator